MNKKVIGAIAFVVVLLLICIPFGMNKLNNSKVENAEATKSSEDNSSNSDNNKSENKNSDGDTEEDKSNLDSDDSGVSDSSNNASSSNNDNGSSTSSKESNSSSQNNSDSSQNKKEKVSSNYKTPDVSLTIQRINGYSGVFVEDGSDKEVKNVAAIQVKNTSKQAIEYGEIVLYNGDKKLTFQVSTVPANSSVVVMEKDKKTLDSKSVTYGKSTVAYTNKLEKDSNINYSVVDNNGIKITNKSKKDIPCVRVFYKYKSEDGYYIGGITYVAKVEKLKAGKSETIYPSHFASDGGQVMMVKTYNE